MQAIRRKFIGDRAFYRAVLAIAVPIMIQNGISTFVNLLDNVMVGRVGTEPMSGVAIVNQLMFVYNLCIFGGLSGAGIFTSQYFGRGDRDGVRHTFRYKLWVACLLTAAAVALFLLAGEALISSYLRGEADVGDMGLALAHGQRYLRVMLLGLPAFMLSQVYTSTLRECSETVLPMKAGITAMLINLALNWVLIYGHLGLPAMGVAGAAAATVIARWAELAIVLLWTHRHPGRCPWITGMYRTLRVPLDLVRRFFIKGAPLLLNEGLWSLGMALLNRCYSERGLSVVAAFNISSTITNLFNVVMITMGSAVAIMIGQLLGAGRIEEARRKDTWLIAFSIFLTTVMALLLIALAPLFPRLYNTDEAVRSLAVAIMRTTALFMPMHAFLNSAYFTLRSGGRTVITFIFDSGSIWLLSLPIAYALVRLTDLSVVWIVALVSAADLAKCVLGYVLLRRGVWAQNLVV
ncbi:MAG: MATE family efflux transporter [Clostridia bacterium]|nr:MATE family efflux transporter [Clostridia bacterium]